MGGAVSTGQDNDDLIDNLLEASYIKTAMVERVFRAVDRGEYFLPGSRGNAYKDLAWKSGHLHISAPCIYSKVMEGLELKPGLSFLNLGSGTGYLSTMVGLILGSSGINHGIELHKDVIQYANKKLADFKRLSGAMDEYDFCEPQYIQGNCLCLISNGHRLYDRVYCGAACPSSEYASYMKKLLKVGGILVMPLNDKLLQIKRVSQNSWEQESLLPVSFATLVVPQPDQPPSFNEFYVEPPSLQCLCRTLVRNILRKNIEMEHCPVKRTISSSNKAPKKKRAVKKIVVPLFDTDTSDDENRANTGRNRSRNTNRVSMNPLENDQLLNFVLGTLDGSRRGFLRSYRRSQNKNTTDSNTSSSEVNKTDESEPMEVELEDDDTRTEETGDNSKTSEQTKESVAVENDTNCTHEGEKGETKDSTETDPVASEDSEMLDKDSNNKDKTDDINKDSPSPSNNERDSSQNTDEGPSYFSVIHMPRSLVIDGVVITNVQAFSDVDEAMNDFINGPSGSENTQNNNDNAGTKEIPDTKVNTSSTQGSSENDNQKSTTELGTNNTKETIQKKSSDGDNESEIEFLCGDCLENEAPSSSKTRNKKSKSKDKSSRRKKFDSGLGDEIVESNMADASSDEECDHNIKFVVKNSSDSDSEDEDNKKDDEDDDDGDSETVKKNFRQGLMWTRIELNRQNSASGNSSDNDNEDSKTDSEEYRMYQSPFTVHMRNKIQKLPLPVMLKKFLNYNRDF